MIDNTSQYKGDVNLTDNSQNTVAWPKVASNSYKYL